MRFSHVYLTNIFILWYFIIIAFCYVILLIGSIPDIMQRFKELLYGEISDLVSTDDPFPVTAVVPVYNEEENIINCVDSILNCNYKKLDIVLVNDGSTDKTMDILMEEYQFEPAEIIIQCRIPTAEVKRIFISKSHPNMRLIDKVHSGIGDTLNVGVNATVTPFFVTIDADSLIEPDAITKLAYVALSEPNVVAVGGAVYILNHCRYSYGKMLEPHLPSGYITALQTPEYIRSFIFSRSGWNLFKGALSYSGTSTMLEKSVVVEVGGYDLDNPAQDAEILVNIHRYMRLNKRSYKITYNPSSFTWTDVPTTFLGFWRQRINWQKGMLRSMFLHFSMFFNPRYGIVGLFSYPFFLLAEVLGPMVEFSAYFLVFISYLIGILDLQSAILLVIVSWGFVAFLTMATVLLNYVTFNKYSRLSDGVKLFFIVFLESFGFRQMLTLCRVWGTIKYAVSCFVHFLFKKRSV